MTDFALTFEAGYPVLRAAWQMTDQPAQAIVQCYLTLPANVPDTLIARKGGTETAAEVSRRAAEALALGGALTAHGQEALAST